MSMVEIVVSILVLEEAKEDAAVAAAAAAVDEEDTFVAAPTKGECCHDGGWGAPSLLNASRAGLLLLVPPLADRVGRLGGEGDCPAVVMSDVALLPDGESVARGGRLSFRGFRLSIVRLLEVAEDASPISSAEEGPKDAVGMPELLWRLCSCCCCCCCGCLCCCSGGRCLPCSQSAHSAEKGAKADSQERAQ